MNKDNVIRMLGEKLDDCEFHFVEVPKNNNTLNGIVVHKKNSIIAPTIYYDENMTDEKIVEYVVSVYKASPSPDLDRDLLGDKNFILNNVYPQVVTYQDNAFVNGKVFKRFLDLAILYRVRINPEMSYLLTEDGIKGLGLSVNEINEHALENFEQTISLNSLGMELDAMAKSAGCEDLIGVVNRADYDILILSSKSRMYGASAILFPNILKKISSAFESNFYVIPSSIHEVLIRKANGDKDEKELLTYMLREVNETEVAPEDVLSNNLYLYDSELEMLRIA